MEFKGKNAVVTGSSGGIGRATAIALAKEGANVVVAARNKQRMAEVVQEIEKLGQKAIAVPYDQTSTDSVMAMRDKALATFGHIDILINNAAIGIRGRVEATSMEHWELIVNTNLLGYVRCIEAFLPQFLERGSGYIVNTSSIQALGYTGETLNVPYITTKGGILSLSESLYAYLAPKGIMVSCLSPGGVNTDMGANAIFVGTEEEKAELRAKDLEMFKLPFFLKPEQVAAGLLEGMKREDYLIQVPESMKEMLKKQGRDIDKLNAFLRKAREPGFDPRMA